ncbi:hypothetical protein E2C01_090787 [Portunus trituberculatus]|uniref:Uncharacterized protein n=1 Tax=Portunus trituberculatus TaxID=210409 RepID=A0A5B7JL93_PORTR|nr:hypothetical protein [Portunus trituberculatus]
MCSSRHRGVQLVCHGVCGDNSVVYLRRRGPELGEDEEVPAIYARHPFKVPVQAVWEQEQKLEA